MAHCLGKLTLDDPNTGEVKERFVLTKWAEISEHNHEGDKAGIITEKIMMEMVAKVGVQVMHDDLGVYLCS